MLIWAQMMVGGGGSINGVPLELIDRIEIYKGVVPAKLGGSAMGGAINIVLKEFPPRYLDASYAYESYNTHKATLVLKRNFGGSGLLLSGGDSTPTQIMTT